MLICTLTTLTHRYDHEMKGEALYAMELVLSLERLNFQKLRALHDVAGKHGDAEMCDFIGAALAHSLHLLSDASLLSTGLVKDRYALG